MDEAKALTGEATAEAAAARLLHADGAPLSRAGAVLALTDGPRPARLFTKSGAAFTLHVNQSLGDDPELDHLLPIVGDDLEIFEVVKDGVLLCKLINFAQAETIDTRCIHLGRDAPLSVFQVTENLNLALNAAVYFVGMPIVGLVVLCL